MVNKVVNMGDLKSYSKAIVSVIMGILVIVEQGFGLNFGIGEEYVTMVLAVIWPILVWLIPNS
jgi:hypothetical protein